MNERALLSALFRNPLVVQPHFLSVPPEAFYGIQHQVLAGIIRDMIIRGDEVDVNTVLAIVLDQGLVSRIPAGDLATIIQHDSYPGNAASYASRVCELYGRRRLAEECDRLMQRLDAEWEAGDSLPVVAAAAQLRLAVDEIEELSTPVDQDEPFTLSDLLSEKIEYDWLVPGLIERMDRMVITGEEGFGKTELVAQILCCLAAGLHPFRGEPIYDGESALRVTVIDCENTKSQSKRRYRRMIQLVDSCRGAIGLPSLSWEKQLYMDFATEGIDLLKGGDVARLERFVAKTSPDILAVGPLYKLHHEDENSSQAARAIVQVLDNIRARHGCAIITEAHAGNGKDGSGRRVMRPRGSSLYLGWPEFGFGLRRGEHDPTAAEFISWRGQREERDWPTGLVRGHPGMLPWRPNGEYWDRPETPR
jgi:replicative DNA helicase